MYVKFPEQRWSDIKRAEEGDVDLYERLREEFIETYWSDPDAKIERDLASQDQSIV